MRLTRTNLSKIMLPVGRTEAIFFDDDMPGFGVRLRAGGKRTWIVQYRFGAKQRRVTLGTVGTLSADLARAEAAKVLSAVTLGRDPQTEKQVARQKASETFGALVPLYLAHAEKRQRAAYHADVTRYLKIHWASLADVPIEKVTRAVIAKNLGELSKTRGTHSAGRARANLSGFFSWAIGEGIAMENPVIGTNRPAEPVARDRVLANDELRLVWRSLGPGDFGAIVRLLILTGCRRQEAAGMMWSEISGGLWTIPGARTKNRRPHELPLSPLALSILDTVPQRGNRDLVFGEKERGFSGWSKSKARLDKRMVEAMHEVDPRSTLMPWRVHDLRRTAATRMADLGVQPHVVEAVLNHVSGSRAGVAGVYNRAMYRDEKRHALTCWEGRVTEIIHDVAQ